MFRAVDREQSPFALAIVAALILAAIVIWAA
jgi:multisubunit Na+/H+ antiporter MnhC subunit